MILGRSAFTLTLHLALLGACTVPSGPIATAPTPQPLAGGAPPPEISIGPLVERLAPSTSYSTIRYGWLCLDGGKRYFSETRQVVTRSVVEDAARKGLEPLGYRLRIGRDSVFTPAVDVPLRLGATVTVVQSNTCHPFSGSPMLNVGNPAAVKGNVSLEIRWELFDTGTKSIVFAETVKSSYQTQETIDDGFTSLLIEAVAASLRSLSALPGFPAAVLTPRGSGKP